MSLCTRLIIIGQTTTIDLFCLQRFRVSSFTVEIPDQEKVDKPDQHEILECALATSRGENEVAWLEWNKFQKLFFRNESWLHIYSLLNSIIELWAIMLFGQTGQNVVLKRIQIAGRFLQSYYRAFYYYYYWFFFFSSMHAWYCVLMEIWFLSISILFC